MRYLLLGVLFCLLPQAVWANQTILPFARPDNGYIEPQVDNIPPPMPRPLRTGEISRNDVARYRDIFDLQARAKWTQANALIARLYDPILMGHVLYQRHMHPNYRSRWRELREWLRLYADHPGARHIYALAKYRKPRRAVMPKQPPPAIYHSAASARAPLFRKRNAQAVRGHVADLIGRERPTQALRYVNRKWRARRINRHEYDALRAIIARSYYIEDKLEKSLAIARTTTAGRDVVPSGDWHAGLAAWRLKKYDVALRHFEYLADNTAASPRLRARGAFWAARVLRNADEIVAARYYLNKAATQGHNFYSLLAQQSLYGEPNISWQRIKLPTADAYKKLLQHMAVRRAIMLMAANARERGEWELIHFQGRLTTHEAQALLRLARELNFAGLELVLGQRFSIIASNKQNTDTHPHIQFYESLYPLLDSDVAGPFTIDRAVVFALIRRESGFKARAYSRARAHGMMQIIPSTAARITGNHRLRRNTRVEELFKIAFNIELGQKYLHRLLEQEFDGNLIHVLAAYNAGPKRLHKWRKRFAEFANDPLLYIESIPFRETRHYVKYVMENIWIYRHRLGQSAVSQQALVNYGWPLYTPQDNIERTPIAGTQTNLVSNIAR